MLSKDIDFSNVESIRKHLGKGKKKTTYCVTFVVKKGKNITNEFDTEKMRDFFYTCYEKSLKDAKAT